MTARRAPGHEDRLRTPAGLKSYQRPRSSDIGCVDGKQIFRRHRAQRDNDLGLDHGDLPHEKWRTGFTLVALRRAVARRTALDYVRDINIFAPQAHRFDHVVEQLAGAADERFALRIFVGARTFAHEHQLRPRIAHSKDDLFAPLFVQFATRAVAEVFADQLERRDRVGNSVLRLRRNNFEDVLLDDGWDDGGFSCGHFLSHFWLRS